MDDGPVITNTPILQDRLEAGLLSLSIRSAEARKLVFQLISLDRLIDQDRKLIAAQPADQTDGGENIPQAFGKIVQHPVTLGMSELVVDPLEPVDVEHDKVALPGVLLQHGGDEVAHPAGKSFSGSIHR